MALTETSYSGTIESPEEMYAKWLQVVADIRDTGQSYRAPGALEIEFVNIDAAMRQMSYWHKRVLARKQYRGRNTADIGPESSESNETL